VSATATTAVSSSQIATDSQHLGLPDLIATPKTIPRGVSYRVKAGVNSPSFDGAGPKRCPLVIGSSQ